jgi:predicted ATPase/DNA-binding SARP family transcriptional activator
MLLISVLGPVEVHHDGESIPIPPGKPTEVLIRLALDAGVMVRTDLLIEDLWGAEAIATDRNTLQTKVTRLRRALGTAASVSGGRAGYTLEVEPAVVDAINVIRMADAARELLKAGAPAPALEACTRALAMFRGEILASAGDGDWLVPHRSRLEEIRLGLVEDRLEVRMAMGATGEVIGELEALVAMYPLREALWALLITALYRDNRQADALDAYQRIRRRLADDLGLEPGPELRALEQQVLLHDRRLNAVDTNNDRVRSAEGNIPAPSSELVGRDADLRELSATVADNRLVTVVGPAGVGKTRLAIEAARGYPTTDGRWLVRLENAQTADSLVAALGDALGMTGPTNGMVMDRLRESEGLLVLDNCEHLADVAAELTTQLLDGAPRLHILVTSQVPLDLDGETVFPLEPLLMADSITLFAKRASERRRSFLLDPDTTAAIEDVCRSLDGLPLAIELAAARTKVLSVQEIARRLDDRFGLLSDPTSRRPQRHRALGTAIAWSYDLLFPDEQRGLWALASFSGGAPGAAAEYVVTALGVPAASAIDIIGRLADRSLVAVDLGSAGTVRYRLLDSVRAFALARLGEAGLADIAQSAHTEWFAGAARAAAAEQRGPEQARHLAMVRTERANIDAALAWTATHDPLLGLNIANDFGWSWVILGEGAVAAGRLRAALASAGDLASPAQRALTLALIGWNESGADIERARIDADQAIEVADTSSDTTAIIESRFALAFVLIHHGHPHASLELMESVRAILGTTNHRWDAGMACVLAGYAGLAAGDTASVRTACEAADAIVPSLGDDWLTSHIEAITGQLAQSEGDLTEAAHHLTRAAEAAQRVGIPAAEGFHLANLGRVLQQAGDYQNAIASLERGIELIRTVGLMRAVALARVRLGRLLQGLGDNESARAALVAADEWFRASGGGEEALLAECLVATLDADDGVEAVADRLESVLRKASDAQDVEVEILTLDALAALHAREGDATGARDLLGRADALMPAATHRIADSDRLHAHRVRSILAT